MSHRSETPFDNIESSHEYVTLLAEAIERRSRGSLRPTSRSPARTAPTAAKKPFNSFFSI